MVFKFFSTLEATEAGDHLAKIVISSVPLEVANDNVKHAKKVASSMRKMSQQIEWIKLKQRFNFFQKAKLGTTLKWKLKDAGYSEEYARELTEWVLMRLK